MKNLFILAFVLGSLSSFAQNRFTISGYISDDANGEALIAANIWSPDARVGSSSNAYGFYSLTLPAGKHIIQLQYLGYATQNFEVDLRANTDKNFQMVAAESLLNEVDVVASGSGKIEDQIQMSKMEVPIKQLKSLPAIMGEVDIMKTLQLLPGVQSGGEGTSGLYVRGGSPDQNLILLDGVPLYNVNHLFGFFSVFNADAISNVSLTKGGFPARYGGRLSSVLEIKMKEGNMREFHGDATASIIASKMTLEGPLVKDKASFMISGRRTYLDVLARPFINAANAQNPETTISPTYYFYDMNGKVNWKIGEKDRVYLSHFQGKDDFGTKGRDDFDDYQAEFGFGLDWRNSITAARWNHQWSPKLFSNVTATRSVYNFNTRISQEERYLPNYPDTAGTEESRFAGLYFSGIEDYGARIDFDYVPNPQHYIRYGGGWTNHKFSPGATNFEFQQSGFNLDTTIGGAEIFSNEAFAYVEDEWNVNENFKIGYGLHLNTLFVENTTYSRLQPRIGMNYSLPGDIALKASYADMMQTVNLLTNEGLGLPTDLWVPSTANLQPQTSQQYAAGLAKNIGPYEFSIEGYYKDMQNLVSYREGASFLFSVDDESWEDKVTQGQGTSYGMEFFAQKKAGKTNGWIGYTLSWSYRQFDEINGGERYFFTYDRRHDISVVMNHELTENINFSAAWVYGTGRAVTLPEFSYIAGLPEELSWWNYRQLTVERATDRNSYRYSPYHRLDVSLSFRKKRKTYERWWTISAYNAYNNLHPFFMETTQDRDGNPQLREYGLFPIIPSIAYRIKF
jgi:outer membrane receptor for ferrienterochelin and colicin